MSQQYLNIIGFFFLKNNKHLEQRSEPMSCLSTAMAITNGVESKTLQ